MLYWADNWNETLLCAGWENGADLSSRRHEQKLMKYHDNMKPKRTKRSEGTQRHRHNDYFYSRNVPTERSTFLHKSKPKT